ncbi:transglycosylase SLT domain-containing protein [Streptomyces megasporus]|uniref:transglycosylase SLT domain-containing protein n=1 Tax=Streptomyces megasporus TaxID=44060 RepID=UPI0004E25735|nr:transglycosylase SLT domain-containing protein [Streptomyces megasporus]
MTVATFLDQFRTAGTRRLSAIGIAAVTGTATLALGFAPSEEITPTASAQAAPAPVKLSAQTPQDDDAALRAGNLLEQSAVSFQKARTDAAEEERKAAADEMAAEKNEAHRQAEAERQAAEKQAAEKQAAAERTAEQQAADRSHEREQRQAAPSYPNNLDGWIREALAIMEREGIPGSYEGIHRNIIRESSGDPRAINTWDINARNGIPSKGLLQVIPPTFEAYHVEGTSWDIYDPVANIVAACNYAADRYGSMDNVYSAY